MCSIKLEDIHGDITDVVFFPKVWEQFQDVVKVDAPILVEGRLDKTRGAPQLSASKASSLLVNGIAESDAIYADTYTDEDREEVPAGPVSGFSEAPDYYGQPEENVWFDDLPPVEDMPMMTDPLEEVPPVPADQMPGCFMIDPEDDAEEKIPAVTDQQQAEAKAVLEDKPTAAEVPVINIPVQQPAADEDDDPPFDIDGPTPVKAEPVPEPVIKAAEPKLEPVAKPAPMPAIPEEPVVSDGLDLTDSVDNLDEELFSFDEKPKPKRLTVVVRVDPNARPGSSGRQIRRLHGLVSSYPGRDRFSFMIVEAGKIYLVDYPDVHTNVCTELINKLTDQVGEENVQVEEKAAIR